MKQRTQRKDGGRVRFQSAYGHYTLFFASFLFPLRLCGESFSPSENPA